jgi:hypothetical protein
LDRGSGGGSTISMTSVALAASGATASETSGTKAACEAGGAVTPTVAAASEAQRLMVAVTEDSVAVASEAERLMVAATEDSVVVASEAERPVVAPEDSVVVASEAERRVVAPEDSVAAASEAERPVVAPEDSVAAASEAERLIVAATEDSVVVASEAEAEAATAVDTARSISSHSKQAAGNFQPLFSFVFGFLQLYRFPKSFMPGNQLRIDLGEEINQQLKEDSWLHGVGRSSKTLVKYDDLRIVLISMKADTQMHEHKAAARISVQTLTGHVQLRVVGRTVDLPAGHLLALDQCLPHDVVTLKDSSILLTLSWPTHEGSQEQSGKE